MLSDRAIATTTHPRIQERRYPTKLERELRSHTSGRHHIKHPKGEIVTASKRRDVLTDPTTRRATTTSSIIIVELLARTLRYRRWIANDTWRQVHVYEVYFTTSRDTVYIFYKDRVDAERDRQIIGMRTSLHIERTISVTEPRIQIRETQTRRFRIEFHKK